MEVFDLCIFESIWHNETYEVKVLVTVDWDNLRPIILVFAGFLFEGNEQSFSIFC